MTTYFKLDDDVAKYKRLNFKRAYSMWFALLLERTLNIFTYKNLPFPQREIELLLTYRGFCGFIKFKKSKQLGVANGSMTGVTNYPDIFTRFVYATPLESGICTIDENCAIINNNELRQPTYYMINHYATLFAHIDLSLQAILINSRATGIAKAKTQQQVDTINNWYSSLANGKTLAILDEENLNQVLNDKGSEILQIPFPTSLTPDSYYQIRENLLKSYYSEIGINSMRDKKERVVVDELDTNVNRILYNVNGMLRQRKDGIDKANKIFGSKIEVDFNEQIKKQMETPKKEGDKDVQTVTPSDKS